MALGHRLQPRNTLWPVAICTVLILGLLQWDFSRKPAHQTAKTAAARRMIESLVLVYEYDLRHEKKSASAWQGPRADASRNELAELVEGLRKESLMDDELWVDAALVYDRFAETSGDRTWNDRASEALRQVKDKSGKENLFVMVEAAINLRALKPETTEQLSQMCGMWPTDWWVARLARANGMDGKVNGAGLAARQNRAVWQFTLKGIVEWSLIAGGVILLWPFCRIVRRTKVIYRRDGLRHLRRLWAPAPTLLCFGLAGLLGVGVGTLGVFSAPYLLGGALRDKEAQWWLWVGYWMFYSVAAFLAWPASMRWCMAPQCGSLARVFNLRWSDFATPRFWFLGIAGSTVMFVLFIGINWVADCAGFSAGESDHLSRNFSTLEGASLPFGLVWGVLLAPWAEELLFRGFLYTGMKNQFGKWGGAVISSMVFSAGHFYGWFGALATFLYGMLFCLIYERTQRLAANMILHGCINAPLIVLKWLEWSA